LRRTGIRSRLLCTRQCAFSFSKRGEFLDIVLIAEEEVSLWKSYAIEDQYTRPAE